MTSDPRPRSHRAVPFPHALLLAALVAFPSACNDGGGGGNGGGTVVSSGSAAPANLAYDDNTAVYTQNVEIVPETPTFTNHPQSFSIAPMLPVGLRLDTGTGVISGRPVTTLPPTDFTVTATNLAGSATVVIRIAIQAGPAALAKFRYPDGVPTWVVGEVVGPNPPSIVGQPTSFQIEPDVVPGLTFDRFTGEISGTPAVAAPARTHTVTASNAAGSVSTELEITVHDAAAAMRLVDVSHGFGVLLPHRVAVPDAAGFPTVDVMEIRTLDDLVDNVRPTNPILPAVQWPAATILPDGTQGNHFVRARFAQPLDPSSVLSTLASSAPSSFLTGAFFLDAVDPSTGATTNVRGRPFVAGFTPVPDPSDPGRLKLERWVGLDGNGKPVALDVGGAQPGLGFPGTESPVAFAGAADLLRPDTIVFVADTDSDLSVHETFPTDVQIRVHLLSGIRAKDGPRLLRTGLASSTVGADHLDPEIAFDGMEPSVVPPNGSIDVPPDTRVGVRFTEPVQPFSVGPFPGQTFAANPPAVELAFGPASNRVAVRHAALPVSPYDLSRYRLDPALDFHGGGAASVDCGSMAEVSVEIVPFRLLDLANIANFNNLAASTFFLVAPGTSIVNAPVTPDVVLVGRRGARPGLSVVDLNGFGAGTGNPTFDPLNPATPGNSNYPNNPNLSNAPQLVPPLPVLGTCTIDGGSEGPFTLTKTSSLDDLVAGPPHVFSVTDMALGHALDRVFNNSAPPFGCQSGGGNLCASTALKRFDPEMTGAHTIGPFGSSPGLAQTGVENAVSWAPHPNPPPLSFPPLCDAPRIGGLEPTSVDVLTSPAVPNLLEPSPDFLGDAAAGIPPQGLASPEQNAWFGGPSPAGVTVTQCGSYPIRQQIGFFLYVCDRVHGEVVVLNSNRFTVLDRIPLPDPTSLAMSPNLDFLAVTNASEGTVSFIATDPSSASFHTVVKTTAVGQGPTGVAWQPDNEDLFVCNTAGGTVSILSAFTFDVRRTLTGHLTEPIEVAVTHRQSRFGLGTGRYYAFLLNADGTLALFESGHVGAPSGFGDVRGVAPDTFPRPKAMVIDPIALNGGVWIAHELAPLGPARGAISAVELALPGPPPPGTGGVDGAVHPPVMRTVALIGPDRLTGVPTDLAFDDLRNLGALPGHTSPAGAGFPIQVNSKSLVRELGGRIVNTNQPTFLFAAIPFSAEGGGAIDVFQLESGLDRLDVDTFTPGTQSLAVEGAALLGSYFRQ